MVSKISRKRILVLDFDLFKSVGGGQTAYKAMISANPDWDFFYFTILETSDAVRPSNSFAIPYTECYLANALNLPDRLKMIHDEYEHSWRLAGSVKAAMGVTYFDVIDAPDYTRRGLFIRHTLELHGIRVGSVAVALHGSITQPLKYPWPDQSPAKRRTVAQLKILERLQYRSADTRYAISDKYAQEWQRQSGGQVNLIDPLLISGPLEPVETSGDDLPDIIFVGRRERRKSPDVFLDIVWCLPKDSYGKVIFIGDENGESDEILTRIARNRGMEIEFRPSIDRSSLDALFRSNVVLIVPSKIDTYNLVALEGLRQGCPTFISQETGFASWLAESYPVLSDLIIDIDCSRDAAGAISATLSNYAGKRRDIVAALSRPGAAQQKYGPAHTAYTGGQPKDERARFYLNEMQTQMMAYCRPRSLATGIAVKPVLIVPDSLFRIGPSLASYHLDMKSDQFRESTRQAHELLQLSKRLKRMPERSPRNISRKISIINEHIDLRRAGRVTVFNELARLERKRGNDYVAAAYHLRVMRWAGFDRFGTLSYVADTLRKNNQAPIARTAIAMYADPARAFQASLDQLNQQFELHLTKPDLPLEIFDDRRGSDPAKVAIIVSLYNAASKLPTLLKNIQLQTLGKAGQIEVILVDSHSPTDEYRVFQEFAPTSHLRIAFCRSEKRETIQAAWNRGIKLARAPYLCFLGADEGIHPECLERLADRLDAEPDLDWITSDSIVTDVDKLGRFDRDVMIYDRLGLSRDIQQLEACYVNYVGGLYRKSIHDRFGYYDETFRGAGDTEFKARLLPHIKVAHYPMTLGVFNNYPEARTTASPMAEIEDLRAWYLHRTPAGIAYRFAKQPASDAWSLVEKALGYRKSYCQHESTDFDMAAVAFDHVRRGDPTFPGVAKLGSMTSSLRHVVREFDSLDFAYPHRRLERQIAASFAWMEAQQELARGVFGPQTGPQFKLFNDNRYEQHWWSWSTA